MDGAEALRASRFFPLPSSRKKRRKKRKKDEGRGGLYVNEVARSPPLSRLRAMRVGGSGEGAFYDYYADIIMLFSRLV